MKGPAARCLPCQQARRTGEPELTVGGRFSLDCLSRDWMSQVRRQMRKRDSFPPKKSVRRAALQAIAERRECYARSVSIVPSGNHNRALAGRGAGVQADIGRAPVCQMRTPVHSPNCRNGSQVISSLPHGQSGTIVRRFRASAAVPTPSASLLARRVAGSGRQGVNLLVGKRPG